MQNINDGDRPRSGEENSKVIVPGSRGARIVTVSSAAHMGVGYNLMVIVQDVVKRTVS